MLDFSNKTVHFIGIGGISCNALAKFVLDFGGKVSGSDAKITPICDELRAKGAKIWQGEAPQNIDADIVVFSSAIRADNKELVFAKQSGAKLYERHEFWVRCRDFSDEALRLRARTAKRVQRQWLRTS